MESQLFRCTVAVVRWLMGLAVVLLVLGCRQDTASQQKLTKKYEVAEEDSSPSPREASPVPAADEAASGLAASAAQQGTQAPAGVTGAPQSVPPSAGQGGGFEPVAPQASPPSTASTDSPSGLTPGRESFGTGGTGLPGGTASPQPIKPPPISREQIENLEPPQGPPEAIWAFIEGLNTRRPRGRTQGEVLQDMRRMLQARVMAAERLFNHPESNHDLRQKAVDVVLTSLQYLNELGAPDVLAVVRSFCTKMAADSDPQIAATGRLMVFSLDVGDLLDEKTKDPAAVVATAQKLLAEEEKNSALFEHLRTAALSLLQSKHRQAGLELVRAIAETFRETTDPALARQVKLMQEEARFLELDLGTKLLAFSRNEPNSLEQLLAGAEELLAGRELGLGTLQQASFIGDTLERGNQVEAARKLYRQIQTAFASTQDAELQKVVKETVDYADRRLGLLNKTFVPSGKTFDGRPFQWADYQGKVVLVTFWSAENIQYLANELPQIKRLREVYKDRGFEVVGVNIDRNRALVEQFLAFQPMPWVTIMDGSDGKGKLLDECGVRSIPFTILINQQGVVTDLHVTAQTLPEKLLKLLSGPAPAGGEAPPSSPSKAPTGASLEMAPEAWYWVSYGAEEPRQGVGQAPAAEDDNPYLAPSELTRDELARFLTKMAEKPASIRSRPGFDEALIDAAERILREESQDAVGAMAIECLLRAWQRLAANDKPGAQEGLNRAVERYRNDSRPAISSLIQWLSLEQELLKVDELPLDVVPDLLARVEAFFRHTKPSAEHLRLASAAVHAINRLEVEKRGPYFEALGKILASSDDRTVARYGKQLAAEETKPDAAMVGERIVLSGITAAGVELNWKAYEGKVVLVDFWATWCGPCLQEIPKLREAYDRWHAKGLEIVGVNLDRSPEAIARFLEQHDLPWPSLIGKDAAELARRYKVRAIPCLWLLDRQGRVVKAAHHWDELAESVEKLLAEQ